VISPQARLEEARNALAEEAQAYYPEVCVCGGGGGIVCMFVYVCVCVLMCVCARSLSWTDSCALKCACNHSHLSFFGLQVLPDLKASVRKLAQQEYVIMHAALLGFKCCVVA